MSFVKLGLDHGVRLFINHNPENIVVFRNTKSKHPVFELSGKKCCLLLENVIRTARLYILLQNLAEAHHLYHKHSLHL